ncbi:MarR family winged helix-turn-helix transcriptional regulator [Streptomyces cirratus]|uniref:MarR family winged helix-turn-helix transcriptional regulator n=1 Tax=Streptomyces cirratus TaxID=68187 RepID=UPI00361057F9
MAARAEGTGRRLRAGRRDPAQPQPGLPGGGLLQTRGLVERIPSPTDARSVRIALTEAGHRAFEEADATRREVLAEVFDDLLDDADIAALAGIWAKLKSRPAARDRLKG